MVGDESVTPHAQPLQRTPGKTRDALAHCVYAVMERERKRAELAADEKGMMLGRERDKFKRRGETEKKGDGAREEGGRGLCSNAWCLRAIYAHLCGRRVAVCSYGAGRKTLHPRIENFFRLRKGHGEGARGKVRFKTSETPWTRGGGV